MIETSAKTVTAILSETLQWCGTPYRHGASRKQVGCDCLGLVRGVWRAVYGAEPETPHIYAPDWAEVSKAEPLLSAARRHMRERETTDQPVDPEPGDLLVFRWRAEMAAKHLGIMTMDGRFIHAYQGHRVLSSALVPQWRRRIAGIFLFPEQKD